MMSKFIITSLSLTLKASVMRSSDMITRFGVVCLVSANTTSSESGDMINPVDNSCHCLFLLDFSSFHGWSNTEPSLVFAIKSNISCF